MLVVNLFGAPGSGKSTGAAYIFSRLKLAGINAELVTEFAKDKVYEESKAVFDNQIYIFGKQYFRISKLYNKVDVVVTDSPLLLSSFYNKNEEYSEELYELVYKIHSNHRNKNYLIRRDKPYFTGGRFQTEFESDAISTVMKHFLLDNDIKFNEYSGNAEGYDKIVTEIVYQLNTDKI